METEDNIAVMSVLEHGIDLKHDQQCRFKSSVQKIMDVLVTFTVILVSPFGG